jgi:hypothetical protein
VVKGKKAFAVKALRRMNGISCVRIKRLWDLEIEFLIEGILSTLCK